MKKTVFISLVFLALVFWVSAGAVLTNSDGYLESYMAQMKRGSEMGAVEHRSEAYRSLQEKCDEHHTCAMERVIFLYAPMGW